MKYIDSDKLIAEIERLAETLPEVRSTMEGLLSLINSLKQEQPSIPSSLDEVADEIAKSEIPVVAGEALDLNGDCYETDDINWPERCGFIRGFKTGVQWSVKQIETIEGYIAGTNEVAAILAIPRKEYNKGDKVVVQIIKK